MAALALRCWTMKSIKSSKKKYTCRYKIPTKKWFLTHLMELLLIRNKMKAWWQDLMKRNRRDWLVPIHCVNHRVELAIKDSFDESPFSAVHKLYNTLFSLFKNSGDIKSNVRQAAEDLEISVYTLTKLTGTQFVSHWRGGFTRLLDMWSAIVIALENRLTACKDKPYTRAKISGLVTELHSY